MALAGDRVYERDGDGKFGSGPGSSGSGDADAEERDDDDSEDEDGGTDSTPVFRKAKLEHAKARHAQAKAYHESAASAEREAAAHAQEQHAAAGQALAAYHEQAPARLAAKETELAEHKATAAAKKKEVAAMRPEVDAVQTRHGLTDDDMHGIHRLESAETNLANARGSGDAARIALAERRLAANQKAAQARQKLSPEELDTARRFTAADLDHAVAVDDAKQVSREIRNAPKEAEKVRALEAAIKSGDGRAMAKAKAKLYDTGTAVDNIDTEELASARDQLAAAQRKTARAARAVRVHEREVSRRQKNVDADGDGRTGAAEERDDAEQESADE